MGFEVADAPVPGGLLGVIVKIKKGAMKMVAVCMFLVFHSLRKSKRHTFVRPGDGHDMEPVSRVEEEPSSFFLRHVPFLDTLDYLEPQPLPLPTILSRPPLPLLSLSPLSCVRLLTA